MIPIKESVQKSKQISVDTSSVIMDKQSAQTTSIQNNNFNSTDSEQLKPTYVFNDKQMLLSKLFASADNFSSQRALHSTTVLSANNEHLLVDSSVQMNKNSILSSKKATRINHYPNMLADFD